MRNNTYFLLIVLPWFKGWYTLSGWNFILFKNHFQCCKWNIIVEIDGRQRAFLTSNWHVSDISILPFSNKALRKLKNRFSKTKMKGVEQICIILKNHQHDYIMSLGLTVISNFYLSVLASAKLASTIFCDLIRGFCSLDHNSLLVK